VAKTVGLFRRGGVFYLRVMLPIEIRRPRGPAKVIRSLGTCDLRVARIEAGKLRASLLGGCPDATMPRDTPARAEARSATSYTFRQAIA
jgi:hypothetical protein